MNLLSLLADRKFMGARAGTLVTIQQISPRSGPYQISAFLNGSGGAFPGTTGLHCTDISKYFLGNLISPTDTTWIRIHLAGSGSGNWQV